MIAICISIFGVALCIIGDQDFNQDVLALRTWDLAVLVNAVSWGVYTALYKKYRLDIPGIQLLFWMYLVSTLFFLPSLFQNLDLLLNITGRQLIICLALGVISGGIGNIAPFILVAMLIIAVASLFNTTDSFADGSRIIRELSAEFRISGSPFAAGVLEFAFIILIQSGYVASVAARPNTSRKELFWGNSLGEFAMFILKILLVVAFILNATAVGGTQVPVLVLGARLGTTFGLIYGIILLLAIYTTVVGMVWIVATNIVPETNKWYKLIVAVVTLVAFGYSMLGSFAQLLNFVMQLTSYVGVVFLICLVVTKIRLAKKLAEKIEAE